jgi:hypothetical protein
MLRCLATLRACARVINPVPIPTTSSRLPKPSLAIAADHGYQITVQQLSFFSSRLNGDHWIWARKGDAWREGFFARERQLDLQAA